MKYRWLIFFSLLGGLLLYTILQAQRLWPSHPSWAASLTGVLFILMFSWQFLARSGTIHTDSRPFRLFAWLGSFLLGIWATFIVFWLPFDIGRDLYAVGHSIVVGHWQGFGTFHTWRWILGAVFMLACGLGGLGLEQALSGPQIRQVDVPIANLPRALENFRIALFTDLHIGPMIREGYVGDVVQKIQSLSPDLIAMTGDLADGTAAMLSEQVQSLSMLKAPNGAYFVTGNHEYYWGAEDWIAKVRDLGFIPLINENRVLTVQGVKILIAGVTDSTAHFFIPEHESNPKKALQSDEKSDLKILLAHRPSSCFEAEPLGFQLQLSGHTHGGQFFPFSELVRFFYKYYRGLNRHGRMWVYVNPGTGYWGPPHRFLVPAEITLLRLKSLHPSA